MKPESIITRIILMLSLGLFSEIQVHSQVRIPKTIYKDLPFEMTPVIQPAFPKRSVSIESFGAVGDGLTDNTKAISDAIDFISKQGGGTVNIPEGIWFTGPIVFKSKIRLNLDRGALVLFSNDKNRYPIVETIFEGLSTRRCQSPVSGRNLEDIAITGEGVIDGNGDAWRAVKKEKLTEAQWKKLVASGGIINSKGTEWYPSESFKKGMELSTDQNVPVIKTNDQWLEIRDYLRPVMVSFINCKNVMLDGVTFQNSPAWCLHPLICENVTISNVSVRNPWYSQNGDGVDLESCRNAIIYKCSFDVGDDAICMKSGKNEDGRKRGIPCENVIVSECVVYHGHGGFTVGSEMSGGIRNFVVSECLFIGTDVGLRFKSTRGRGGVVENIHIRDINMINIPNEAILFDLFYGGKDPGTANTGEPKDNATVVPPVTVETPSFRDIFISNVTCNGAMRAMLFNGLPEMNLKNINVKSSVFNTSTGADIRETDGVSFNDVEINAEMGPVVKLYNVSNCILDKVRTTDISKAKLEVGGRSTKNVSLINSVFNRGNTSNSSPENVLNFR